MAEHINTALRILRRRQLEDRTGLKKSAIYDRLNPKSPNYDPDFPKPIDLGTGKNPPIGFVEHEVEAWLAKRIAQSRKAA